MEPMQLRTGNNRNRYSRGAGRGHGTAGRGPSGPSAPAPAARQLALEADQQEDEEDVIPPRASPPRDPRIAANLRIAAERALAATRPALGWSVPEEDVFFRDVILDGAVAHASQGQTGHEFDVASAIEEEFLRLHPRMIDSTATPAERDRYHYLLHPPDLVVPTTTEILAAFRAIRANTATAEQRTIINDAPLPAPEVLRINREDLRVEIREPPMVRGGFGYDHHAGGIDPPPGGGRGPRRNAQEGEMILADLRRFAQDVKNTGNDTGVISLAPLVNSLKTTPTAPIGLILVGVSLQGETRHFQVAGYCMATAQYMVFTLFTEFTFSASLTMSQLCTAYGLDVTHLGKYLDGRRTNITALGIRLQIDIDKHTCSFHFKDVANTQSVDITVSLSRDRNGGGTSRGSGDRDGSGSDKRRRVRPSDATLTNCTTSHADVCQISGKEALSRMIYYVGPDQNSTGREILYHVRHTMATQHDATEAMNFRVDCLSHWLPTDEATARVQQAKTTSDLTVACPGVHLPGEGLRNLVTFWQRVYGLHGPLLEALAAVPGQMVAFVSDRTHVMPTLATNSFCITYLNFMLKDVAGVFANPDTTTDDFDLLVARCVVNEDTRHYLLTENARQLATEQLIHTLAAHPLLRTTGKRSAPGASTSGSTSPPTAQVTPKKAKTSGPTTTTANSRQKGAVKTQHPPHATKASSERHCWRHHTNHGCQNGAGCRHIHATARLTTSQREGVTRSFDAWKVHHPDSDTALVEEKL